MPEPGEPSPTPSAARSVLANWLWYLLVLASGFVLPRLFARHLGAELLGVWDLGWSFVFYVRWLNLGITASANRYVARYRSLCDWPALNASASTGLLLLSVACGLGLLLAMGLSRGVAYLLPGAAPEVVRAAGLVVMLLSISAALQLPGGLFNAIITGYERFDVLNVIRVARDAAVMLAIIVLLYAGHGIVAAAGVVLIGEILADCAKVLVARRLCPQLRVSPARCRRAVARELVVYGGKTVAQGMARGSLYQLNNILVAWFLGPVAVAVYSRQRALVVHTLRFMKQYAQVFIPKSSALDAGGDTEALRRLLIVSTRYGLYVTLPVVLLLVFMGGPLLDVWMGAGFEAPIVLAILAVGHLAFIPQQSVYSILLGMNRHGRVAVYDFGALVASVGLGWFLMGPMGLGMSGAAVAVAVPMAVSGGILMPAYAYRRLGLRPAATIARIIPGPLLASLPWAACLLLARLIFAQRPIESLVWGVGAGAPLSAFVYWRWVLPADLRRRTRRAAASAVHVLLPGGGVARRSSAAGPDTSGGEPSCESAG